ncbi:MAG: ADP-forming succinate--CoA ligase subunit beta [Candidatus Rhabdochlamydia sp.]
MHLHEYQAKEIFQKALIPTPDFRVISSSDEVSLCLKELQTESAFVKVQVHAGGRGKAGGVKRGNTPQEVVEITQQLLSMRFMNEQTAGESLTVHQVLLTPPVTIIKEYYLSVTFDRTQQKVVLIASSEGGGEIEATAHQKPHQIVTFPLHQTRGLKPYHLLRLSQCLGWDQKVMAQGKEIIEKIKDLFFKIDALLIEINPLVLDEADQLWALDGKITLDDNSLFRQPSLLSYCDPSQESVKERQAKEFDLSYIELSGDIGCIVNGAGLAMATMDMIHHEGGKAANFLDVGGSATTEKIHAALNILFLDEKVKVILINIFGGIMNCETFAQGVIQAFQEIKRKIPVFIRMEGTNSEEGRALLKQSQIQVVFADDLTQLAQLAAQEGKQSWGS